MCNADRGLKLTQIPERVLDRDQCAQPVQQGERWWRSNHDEDLLADSNLQWFSESGKLVMKLFRQIQELVEDQTSLICVLIGASFLVSSFGDHGD